MIVSPPTLQHTTGQLFTVSLDHNDVTVDVWTGPLQLVSNLTVTDPPPSPAHPTTLTAATEKITPETFNQLQQWATNDTTLNIVIERSLFGSHAQWTFTELSADTTVVLLVR